MTTYPQFPRDFILGAATSAYQVEGGWKSDGKGLSIWDVFAHKRGRIPTGDTGDIACNTYHDYQADLEIMKVLGLDAYRFSISWPRVIPEGKGNVNQKGLDYYNRLVDALLAMDVEPFITLYHWDMPHALETELGGFIHKDCARHFAEYCQVVAAALGDRVKYWITLNEPRVHALHGYVLGRHAPGRRDPRSYLKVIHHQLLAHGLGLSRIKSLAPRSQVGIALDLNPIHPRSDSEKNREAALLADQLVNGIFLEAIFRGRYPEALWRRLRLFRPTTSAADLVTISQPIDFLGVNHYSRAFVQHAWYVPFLSGRFLQNRVTDRESLQDEVRRTSMGWEIYPQGIYEVLARLKDSYGNPPVFVTENGAAFTDALDNGRVHDPFRIRFLEGYMTKVAQAIQTGARVRGYFVWSLLDNLEWEAGFSKRFGLVYVNHQTQARIIKDSGFWYAQVIKNQEERST